MINLKKIVAVTLAATMCLGVSMTTFASTLTNQNNPNYSAGQGGIDMGSANNGLQAEGFEKLNQSPLLLDDANRTNGGGVNVVPTNGDGEYNNQLKLKDGGINKGSSAWNSVNSVNEIADILSENGLSVPSGTKVIAIASGVVSGLSDEQDNVLTFTLSTDDFSSDPYDQTKYHAGDEIWAMFETGENTGVWEMRSGVVKGDGKVDFDVDHKGGFILIKTMKNGRVVAIEKDAQGNASDPVVVDPGQTPGTSTDPAGNQGTSNNASAGAAASTGSSALGTSPKTGEF